MDEATRTPHATEHDDNDVWEVLRVRRLEVLDDDGNVRIHTHAHSGGSAGIFVDHPTLDRLGDPIARVGLEAGRDAEDSGPRAELCFHDGANTVEVDVDELAALRAQVADQAKRIAALEVFAALP